MSSFQFTPFPEIKTERLLLRALKVEDVDAVFLLRSDPEVNKYLDRPRASSPAEALDFIVRVNQSVNKNEAIMWAIEFLELPGLLGTICFWNLSAERSSAEIGYELLPPWQGKGILREAIKPVISFGFDSMKLQEIEAELDPANEASVRILEENGFIRIEDPHSKPGENREVLDTVVYRKSRQ
jgi:ribosomal-protein-alanine N-acetyltransferase